jgi:threonine/homoserine/homoserine lactone efflux protein
VVGSRWKPYRSREVSGLWLAQGTLRERRTRREDGGEEMKSNAPDNNYRAALRLNWVNLKGISTGLASRILALILPA